VVQQICVLLSISTSTLVQLDLYMTESIEPYQIRSSIPLLRGEVRLHNGEEMETHQRWDMSIQVPKGEL